MKHSKAVLILIIIALLAFLISILTYSYWKVVFVQNYEVTLSVGDRIGFDLGSERISFGTMLPGTDSSRQIEIANSLNKPIKVIIKQSGDTNSFVSTKENILFIEAKEAAKIDFLAKVPIGTPYGNYTGKILIRALRT